LSDNPEVSVELENKIRAKLNENVQVVADTKSTETETE
jgi:hypothetical protein